MRHSRITINALAGSMFWIVVAVYVAVCAYKMGLGIFREPGPGFIFFLSSLALMALSLSDIVLTLRQKQKSREVVWANIRWHKILLVLGYLIAYIILFEHLGFIICTFLLMTFLFALEEIKHWWLPVLSSLATIAITYLLFRIWLQVPFPTGFLGF